MLKLVKATLYFGETVYSLTGGEAPALTKNGEARPADPDDLGDLAFLLRDADFEPDEPDGDRLILETDEGVKALADAPLLADAARFFEALWNDTREVYTLRLSSFDGGGPEYRAEMEPSGVVTWVWQKQYYDPDHDNLCGAGFDVIYSFRPLRPGKARAVITGRAFYGEEPPVVVDFTVDEALHLSHRETKSIPQP